MEIFETALADVFTHPDFGQDASFYRKASLPPEGEGQSLRVLLRQPDTLSTFGDTRIVNPSIIVEARTIDIASPPVAGDLFIVGSRSLLVVGGAHQDSARLAWVCEAIEQ